MGWRLVVEILDHCPDIKYRQFRVLISLALDARDETRQGMPGTDKLTLQANCAMRQTRQAIADLKNLGLIKTARRPAPGVRAVYEILPMAGNGCGHSRTRTGAETQATGADSGATGAAQHRPHSVTSLSHSSQSSLSRAEAALAAAGATERETELIITKIRNNPKIQSKAAYLRSAIANGDAEELITSARADLELADRIAAMRSEPPVAKPSTNGTDTSIPATSVSVLCQDKQHDTCTWSHCRCRCHVTAEAKAELDRIRRERRL